MSRYGSLININPSVLPQVKGFTDFFLEAALEAGKKTFFFLANFGQESYFSANVDRAIWLVDGARWGRSLNHHFLSLSQNFYYPFFLLILRNSLWAKRVRGFEIIGENSS